MSFQINCTQDGTKNYPLHTHSEYEIMYYIQGDGFLKTKSREFAFMPGTIIVVPPGIDHGSSSTEGFKNICVCGEFEWIFDLDEPLVLKDNEFSEGRKLAELIFCNRFLSNEYLTCLCKTYAVFISNIMEVDDFVNSSVKKIITEISNNANDTEFSISQLLDKSGYSKDYIRTVFKDRTGKTPTEFLTSVRMKNACHLIEVYKNKISLPEVAQRSGFLDYAYFSKMFKRYIGTTPSKYRDKFFGA